MARYSIVGRRVRDTAFSVVFTQAAMDAVFDAALAAAERDAQWVSLYVHDANATAGAPADRYLEIRRGPPVE